MFEMGLTSSQHKQLRELLTPALPLLSAFPGDGCEDEKHDCYEYCPQFPSGVSDDMVTTAMMTFMVFRFLWDEQPFADTEIDWNDLVGGLTQGLNSWRAVGAIR